MPVTTSYHCADSECTGQVIVPEGSLLGTCSICRMVERVDGSTGATEPDAAGTNAEQRDASNTLRALVTDVPLRFGEQAPAKDGPTISEAEERLRLARLGSQSLLRYRLRRDGLTTW
jgi:hypothetical protein